MKQSMNKGIHQTAYKGNSKPSSKVVANNETTFASGREIEYAKEPIPIGTPTDISEMKVTVLKNGEKPKEKPVRFNDTIFKPKSELVKKIEKDAQKKEKVDKRKKYDYRKADAMIHDPKYQWDGSPDIVLIAHETGIPKNTLYHRYSVGKRRGQRPKYDYTKADLLAKDKKYQKENGRPSASKIATATGIPVRTLQSHFYAKGL